MVDPFPALTTFLTDILLYMIYIGVVLTTISGVVSGILFLPIWGGADRMARGMLALRLTGLGFLIIVLALSARSAMLSFFPIPTTVPAIPLATPVVTPVSTVTGS